MDNIKGNKYYINKILLDLDFLIKHTKDICKNEFRKNELLLDSIMFRFIQISEHIKKLTPDFRNKYANIPWKDIIGLRNRIVHEYGNVDLNIIYDTVKVDIYEIEKLFKSID
ncbi:MAG: DUF86 domain-containing protein [Tenericutes bacterium]|nr:DUF86 domain-containing protein [Mycoplasmatota bacterium]